MTRSDGAMTRRFFLFGISAIAGAVVLSDFDLADTAAPTSKSISSPEITVWVLIDSGDSVTIRVARSEMGQGTLTGLAMLVAEELECE